MEIRTLQKPLFMSFKYQIVIIKAEKKRKYDNLKVQSLERYKRSQFL